MDSLTEEMMIPHRHPMKSSPMLPPAAATPPAELGETMRLLDITLDPRRVVHGARSGSHMHNLHTAALLATYQSLVTTRLVHV